MFWSGASVKCCPKKKNSLVKRDAVTASLFLRPLAGYTVAVRGISMSQTLSEPPLPPAPPSDLYLSGDDFPRKRWNVKECRFLQEAGLLAPGKYELIEGDIVEKMPQGIKHIIAVNRLLVALIALFGMERLLTQAPVGIGSSDTDETTPEPDVAVMREPLADYALRGFRPALDVLLVVEVSVSTLTGDTKVKDGIYARAKVPEYWVLDVEGRRLIVHRAPGSDKYASVVTLDENQTVSPLAAPDAQITVRDLLP